MHPGKPYSIACVWVMHVSIASVPPHLTRQCSEELVGVNCVLCDLLNHAVGAGHRGPLGCARLRRRRCHR